MLGLLGESLHVAGLSLSRGAKAPPPHLSELILELCEILHPTLSSAVGALEEFSCSRKQMVSMQPELATVSQHQRSPCPLGKPLTDAA